ncbi:MAG TPA: hypothetical protein PLP30_01495 [Clostridia bacterium]|nr:hypothetical protein [Clostridia bacterium]HPQ46020.1 hypothetical protein [Clostridia bacterium]HRX42871.1 hypothetical protein [Clostridia bacterium]
MDGRKKEAVKRILAGIGAILFVLLIVNLFIWQYQIAISLGLYVLLIMLYLFIFNKRKNISGDDGDNEELPE